MATGHSRPNSRSSGVARLSRESLFDRLTLHVAVRYPLYWPLQHTENSVLRRAPLFPNSQGTWHASDAQSNCAAHLVRLLRSSRLYGWHVCTAHFSQMRLNVADMLFYFLLDTSVTISPELKLFERCPLRTATANKKGWRVSDEEQNDTDLKMSAGVAFLIVYSHCSAHRHDPAEGSWQTWTRVISYTISYNWKEIEKAKNVSWLFCWKDGSSLLGISLNLASQHHWVGELWGSLSFWRDYRSEHHNLPPAITTATRAAEL